MSSVSECVERVKCVECVECTSRHAPKCQRVAAGGLCGLCLAAGDCMPARVAPVSLWTDTGAVRCVTKAFSACPNQRTNSCAPHGAPLTYVTLSVRVFPLGGNTRVTRRVCYPPSVMVPRSA